MNVQRKQRRKLQRREDEENGFGNEVRNEGVKRGYLYRIFL